MNLPYSNPKHRTREELFFDFYARLLDWASQLVHHDQSEAEDLAHDLYIQFVRVDRTVEKIENIEAYLFTTLRNLHYSRMRRAGHDPINDFSIVDYDSVELGLAAVDRRQLLYVRSNLKQICRYACQRKGAARSAGILILRFFFGYYPSEVMKITQSSRMAVDRSLQLARKEARQNLDRPHAVQPIAPGKEISVSFGASDTDSENLFTQLREAIFSSREGECFAEGVLEQRYAAKPGPGFTTPELAHLVSCRVCLDRANRILGLPLLSERSPEDALDHDTHSDSDGSGGPTGTTEDAKQRAPLAKKDRQRQRLERRVRQLFEHRPASLQIAVNGEVRASQIVTSEVSELYLKLGQPEQPTFIEVLSEQGLCLVYLQVEQPAYTSGLAQSQSIVLSEDRTLCLSLSFAADVPIVHVIYQDPILSESTAAEEQPAAFPAARRESRNPAILPNAVSTKTEKRNRIRRFILRSRLWCRTFRKSFLLPNMSPLLVSGTVLAIASIICFSLWIWGPARITSKTLLQRAAASEITVAAGPSQVIRQRIRIRASKRTLERSIYRDSSGRRHARQLPLDTETARLEEKLATSGISWDQPLSALSYRNWHDHVQVQDDAVDSSVKGLLKLTTTLAGGDVAQESLTVRASDFHPVVRTVSFRDAGTVEIAELEYEQLPWALVDSSLFEPIGGMSSNVTNSSPRIHPSLSHAPAMPLGDGELDEAELGAMLVLHQLRADEDGRIQLVRKPNGVQVKGIVETEDRKREVEARLNMVPHVMPFIFTFQELQSRQSPEFDITSVGAASGVASPSPLEKYLVAKHISRDELSAFSRQLSMSSSEIRQDSIVIASLSKRFAGDQQLTASARASLNQLLAQRAANISDALEEEQRVLGQIGFASASASAAETSNADLPNVAERNRKLCEELISGAGPESRNAEQILPDLLQTMSQIRSASHQAAAATNPHPLTSQKP